MSCVTNFLLYTDFDEAGPAPFLDAVAAMRNGGHARPLTVDHLPGPKGFQGTRRRSRRDAAAAVAGLDVPEPPAGYRDRRNIVSDEHKQVIREELELLAAEAGVPLELLDGPTSSVTFRVGRERHEVVAQDGDTVEVPRDEDGSWSVEWDSPGGGGGSTS